MNIQGFVTLLIAVLVGCAASVAGAAEGEGFPQVKHMIDTHIHLFDTSREKGVPWPRKNDTVLYKPHLPDEFKRVSQPTGVTGVVIVEASGWMDDNQWVLDLVQGDDYFVGLVGHLDLTSREFPKHLERLAADPRFVGIRASAPIDFGDDVVLANLRTLAERGLTIDLLPHAYGVRECDQVARAVPNLRMVVDHAIAYAPDGKPVDSSWEAETRRLAENKNVYCKISGLYEHAADQPAPKDIDYYRPMLDVLWDAFGRDRLVYGSNWPVTKKSGDYASYVRLVNAYFSEKGQEACERYYWKNSAAAYRLDLK